MSFGMLGASTLGTIPGRSWDIGEHKEGNCEVQAWIYRFLADLGDAFKEVVGYIWTEKD